MPPTIISHSTITPPNRPPNCRASPYIMPSYIGTPLVGPIKQYTNQTSNSIAKKVTDDLFASSTFFGPKTMTNDNYCLYLKEQLKKCTNKHEDCRHIKDMHNELCSSHNIIKSA